MLNLQGCPWRAEGEAAEASFLEHSERPKPDDADSKVVVEFSEEAGRGFCDQRRRRGCRR